MKTKTVSHWQLELCPRKNNFSDDQLHFFKFKIESKIGMKISRFSIHVGRNCCKQKKKFFFAPLCVMIMVEHTEMRTLLLLYVSKKPQRSSTQPPKILFEPRTLHTTPLKVAALCTTQSRLSPTNRPAMLSTSLGSQLYLISTTLRATACLFYYSCVLLHSML